MTAAPAPYSPRPFKSHISGLTPHPFHSSLHSSHSSTTKTNTFKDQMLGVSSLTHTPIYYVGYNEPSREDEAWSLLVVPVNLSEQALYNAEPTHLQMVWKYILDDQAKVDYPLFNELAAEYNWRPLRPFNATHAYTEGGSHGATNSN